MLCIRQPLQTRQAHNHTNTTSRSNSNFVFVTLQTTKPQPLPGYLCAPNLYTPGNHNFHSHGPLGRWYTTWVYTTLEIGDLLCWYLVRYPGIKKNNVVSYICYTNHTALEFFLAFSFFNLAFFNFGTTPPV